MTSFRIGRHARRTILLPLLALAATFSPLAAQQPGRRLSLAEHERALAGAPPMTVAFDIDDTALHSSYAMAVAVGAFAVLHPDVAKPMDDCRLFSMVNDSLDARWSRPKTIATALIAFHQARGDTITFITGRCASVPATDSTANLLQRLFSLRAKPAVYFSEQGPKTAILRRVRPAIFYGDADGDMRDALAVRQEDAALTIRPVRVVRSPWSTNFGAMNPGRFGEDVLLHSED